MNTLACILAAALGPITALLARGPAPGGAREIVIDRDNIVVTRSVRIKPGTYVVPDRDRNGVLRVTGGRVVLDFQGATLTAVDPAGADLSRAEGIGIAIEGARHVTIRNANVHGYRFNVRARRAPDLQLENIDASLSRAQRIARGGHPLNVWLHLRSLAAWRSYGAGFWIEASDRSTIRRCRAGGAQNGLLLVNTAGATVTGCDFSFNSGFGLGLWGARRNVVAWNLIDFVNRPWGGGWGGDSAGLVVVNGSHENVIAGNSLTHGGDGFFLTDRVNGGFNPRQRTTSIEGSSDRNLIAANDASWSPNNAFEGTFSRGNVYYQNLANDSRYGFWLGYSDDSWLLANEILRHRAEGIAIEHGAGTRVEGNTLADIRGAAVALWSSADWLDKLHPSRDLDLRDNVIRDCGRAFRLDRSTRVSAGGNRITNTRTTPFPFLERPSPRTLARFRASARFKRLQKILAARPRGFVMLRDAPGPKGVDWIQVDDFAPRDYRGQLVAWRNRDACTLELYPLGSEPLAFAKPEWITARRDPRSGTWLLSARPAAGPGEVKDCTIEVRSGQGARTQTVAGRFVTARWEVRWYRWDRPEKLAYDDRAGWARLFASTPIHRQTTRLVSKKLWAGGLPEGVPRGHFALVASTRVKLRGGRYRLSTLSDDGLRVFLDGREVISRWTHHGPTPDRAEVEIRGGVHAFVIHYCQETGASALAFTWRRIEP